MTEERGEIGGIDNLRATLEAAHWSAPIVGLLACEDANAEWGDAGGGHEFDAWPDRTDCESVGRTPWHWDRESYDDAKGH